MIKLKCKNNNYTKKGFFKDKNTVLNLTIGKEYIVSISHSEWDMGEQAYVMIKTDSGWSNFQFSPNSCCDFLNYVFE